jgi:hypothetical protein
MMHDRPRQLGRKRLFCGKDPNCGKHLQNFITPELVLQQPRADG